ncbi:MAG: tRNA 4-thiouridine(8) synthase ThiI [Spirochaetales bacterium]|nr:tRNA 4-thiouridine(8) synthase ThiI [Spirochaetales bacterium]
MDTFFLIKYGEISLKGENRKVFIDRLKRNIKTRLKEFPVTITIRPGRFYLTAPEEYEESVRNTLLSTFGITGFSKALKVNKDMEFIQAAAISITKDMLEKGKGTVFKIDIRRTDKHFPYDSYGLACKLGDILRTEFPELTVNCTRPDWILNIEIRDAAYLYGDEEKGPGGLPVACAGRGLLLLSGGIDSPVAGYLMAKRGLSITALYFHTPPFTSDEVKEKVICLTQQLSRYIPRINLLIVPFTNTQLCIKEKAKQEEVTLLSRAAMMKIATMIAGDRHAGCLITGENLSQVASQTTESIRFTGSYAILPVFRPLIGFDKNEIVHIARQIGTYNTSILPFPDCCTLFAPPYPLIKPDFERMRRSFDALEMEPLLEEAAGNTELVTFTTRQTGL